MTGEEVIEEMNKYTEILEQSRKEFLYGTDFSDDETADRMLNALDESKHNIHKAAIECLNKILTPELKVFVRNLCFNQLGFPDEPIFYKMFGEYPQVGDRVSEKKLEEQGINPEKIKNEYFDYWGPSGNDVIETTIGGKKYFEIDYLGEGSDEKISDETKEQLRALSEARKIVSEKIKSDKTSDSDKEEYRKIRNALNNIKISKLDL